MKRFLPNRTLRTVLIYVLFAEAWILFSDKALEILVHDPAIINRLQTVKGALFVALTAVLLYVLIQRHVDTLRAKERAVRDTSAYLRGILDAVPAMLIGVDENGTITQWNRTAREATGLTWDEVRGTPLAETLPHPVLATDSISEVIRQGQALVREKIPRNAEGTTRFENVGIHPLAAEGIMGAVIRIDDVTSAINMESLLIQSEKMMSLGTLAAGMAHEINNPLAGISQSAQSLRRRLMADLPANIKAANKTGCDLEVMRRYMRDRDIPRFIEAIGISVQRASGVIADMVALGHPTDGDLMNCDLHQSIDKAIALAVHHADMRAAQRNQRLEIERDFVSDMPPVSCSPPDIGQVLLKLLVNAAQAFKGLADTGKARITVRTSREQEWAVLRVADNGPGMDEATRRRVFEPFFTTRSPGSGTGLGLSVAYFVITGRHGGKMDVESAPGRGTVFTIRLPLARTCDLTEPPS